MSDLRSKTLRIASELPKGDPTRRKLLAALERSAVSMPKIPGISGGADSSSG